jgi:hypothetical protein
MKINILGSIVLLLAPAALAYVLGYNDAAHYLALGALLALQLGLLARPLAGFAILLPLVYAAAAITAESTDGVAALIVATAATVGAASSQGLHRGLLALLAAALLGSFEPAAGGEVVRRAAFLAAGCSYGYVLVVTFMRGIVPATPVLQSPSAVGYAVLLAAVALLGWFAARLAGFEHAWWLPLAMVSVSEPVAASSTRDALLRGAAAATIVMLLVFATEVFASPWARGVLLLLALYLALTVGLRRYIVWAVLLVPLPLLLSSHSAAHQPPLDYLRVALAAFLPLLAISGLGHWLYWMLRSGSGRVAA